MNQQSHLWQLLLKPLCHFDLDTKSPSRELGIQLVVFVWGTSF